MAKHKIVLTTTFTPATIKSPRFTNSKVSKLNVEKVDSPPQKPVSSKGLIMDDDENAPFSPNKKTEPAKTRQLKTFANSVDQGNAKNCMRVNQRPNT